MFFRFIFLYTFLPILIAFIFNEYFIYYVAIFQCGWPDNNGSGEKLRALVLSDPHLLGEIEGHWFDKLRREWQMYRSFQTSISLLRPEVVFILGDLTDEGKWATGKQWDQYVVNAKRLFATPPGVRLYVVVGNHDIGFHHDVTNTKLTRFLKDFSTKNVETIELKGHTFVIVNSMGLEGDGCFMCQATERQLQDAMDYINCENSMKPKYCNSNKKHPDPILLTHIPLFRTSDIECVGSDAGQDGKQRRFNYKDTLKESTSERLLNLVNPRLILSGHTHNTCHRSHKDGTPEVTVASYSWRNRNDPSFYLFTITNDDITSSKCHLPTESTVFTLYGLAVIASLFTLKMACNRNMRCTSKIWKRL
nr:metallophosphoesterase 1 isoform X1 [Ciona intestinalis]|eukprot:XP_009860101.1 metallophosphoesterase 1 isoform X1 [Ciona intestinalis]